MGGHIEKSEEQRSAAGNEAKAQIFSEGILLSRVSDMERTDSKVGHHKHMLSEGGKGEGEISSLILPHHLNNRDSEHHGRKGVQEAPQHVPDHISLFDILIRADEKGSQQFHLFSSENSSR